MSIPADLRIITIKQPWASLIINGIKDVENRGWPFPGTLTFPCTIAIHAGAKLDPKSTATELPTRVVLGLVDVIDCHAFADRCCKSAWRTPATMMYHWGLANPVKFAEPISAVGRMGLMPVWPELHAAICEAVESQNLI